MYVFVVHVFVSVVFVLCVPMYAGVFVLCACVCVRTQHRPGLLGSTELSFFVFL